MGRPIKKKFFGNINTPPIGGEGFLSVAVLNTTTNDLYSTVTNVTWSASAPQLPDGVAASGTASVSGEGRIVSLSVGTAGSGYISTASVTVTFSPATTGTGATYQVALTNSNQNSIAAYAFIPAADGGTSGLLADIIKQESSRRYLVKTSEGTGQVRLTAADTGSLTAGQMNIIATDVNGSTYYVNKLTARRAYVSTATDNGGFEYVDGTSAGWSLDAATTGTLSLANN